ncbi:MAG: hypothetical protein HYX48_03085 [Chlamydiales bacterium]|nr:hypothetical protein [Chlamydiales bacterium]
MAEVSFGTPVTYSALNRIQMTTTEWLTEFVDDALDIFGTQKAVIYIGNVELEEKQPDAWQITALKIAAAIPFGIFLLIAKVVLRCSHTYQITPPPTPGREINLNFEKLFSKYELPGILEKKGLELQTSGAVGPADVILARNVTYSFPTYLAFDFVVDRINRSIATHGPQTKVEFESYGAPAPSVISTGARQITDISGAGTIHLLNTNYDALPHRVEPSKNLLSVMLKILKDENYIDSYREATLSCFDVFPVKAPESKDA